MKHFYSDAHISNGQFRSQLKSKTQHLLNLLMLRLFSFLFLAIILMPQDLIAQDASNTDDLIIKECFTLQVLETEIPKNILDQSTEYLILDHGTEIDFTSNLEINGKIVSWISKGELNQTNLYFDFFTFQVEGNKAFSSYYVNYSIHDSEYTISVDIELIKINSVWEVTNYSIKK